MAKRKKGRMVGGARCGTSRSGTRVCISKTAIPGMKCGYNKRNKLYACAKPAYAAAAKKRGRK